MKNEDNAAVEAIVIVDEQGRVNLPASALEALHLEAPGALRAHVSEGRVELTAIRKPAGVVFQMENGVMVAVNSIPFDAVSAIAEVRQDRV